MMMMMMIFLVKGVTSNTTPFQRMSHQHFFAVQHLYAIHISSILDYSSQTGSWRWPCSRGRNITPDTGGRGLWPEGGGIGRSFLDFLIVVARFLLTFCLHVVAST
jgi:hypothetical protein